MCLPSTFPIGRNLIPPLRLVLTTYCNGICGYCHHEGEAIKNMVLPVSVAVKCAEIAETLRLPEISMTGGEPTLYPDFCGLISQIQRVYHGNISLTTNGYLLSKCQIDKPIHTINLSISSFSKDVYEKYQKVDPNIAIESMMQFPATNKNVNIVVTDDNYKEIKTILDRCQMAGIPADLMFELREYSKEDVDKHRQVLSVIEDYGTPYIQLGTTVTIIVNGQENFRIRIKHPKLSKLLNREICASCDNEVNCYERLCAVRVHPDGSVSPCLNNQYRFTDGDIEEQIESVYSRLSKDNAMLSTLLC